MARSIFEKTSSFHFNFVWCLTTILVLFSLLTKSHSLPMTSTSKSRITSYDPSDHGIVSHSQYTPSHIEFEFLVKRQVVDPKADVGGLQNIAAGTGKFLGTGIGVIGRAGKGVGRFFAHLGPNLKKGFISLGHKINAGAKGFGRGIKKLFSYPIYGIKETGKAIGRGFSSAWRGVAGAGNSFGNGAQKGVSHGFGN